MENQEHMNEIIEVGELSRVESPVYQMTLDSGMVDILSLIRPEWEQKSLIERTKKLLRVDPSSACQRIFNATIHDLRDKIVIAGLDIASNAARTYNLPDINSQEDVRERYDTTKILKLAWRMGILDRPTYRKLTRVYDIRKDLEHEDDIYEATISDVMYFFETCITGVLSREPIQILKITEIKEIINEDSPVVLEQSVVEDFDGAPSTRQLEILKLLVSNALDDDKADIIRENSYSSLEAFSSSIKRETKTDIAEHFQNNILKRNVPEKKHMRIANALDMLRLLRRASVNAFYSSLQGTFMYTTYHWRASDAHGELLRSLQECGGIKSITDEGIKNFYVIWLLKCYLGESGGYGYGINRPVFFSNIGAPLAYDILINDVSVTEIENVVSNDAEIRRIIQDRHVNRRLQTLLDNYSEN